MFMGFCMWVWWVFNNKINRYIGWCELKVYGLLVGYFCLFLLFNGFMDGVLFFERKFGEFIVWMRYGEIEIIIMD